MSEEKKMNNSNSNHNEAHGLKNLYLFLITLTLKEEIKMNKDNNCIKYELGEHIDCLDTVNKWLNAEIT